MLILSKTGKPVAALVVSLLMVSASLAWGGSRHGGHNQQQTETDVHHEHGEILENHGDSKPSHSAEAMKHHDMGGHAHNQWVSPPGNYAGKRGTHWFEPKTIAHGEKLYQEHCIACHGQDGQGTGELAASLEHPPADLTKHFHQKPGENDDYLFWRVSEGGRVKPFAAMKSAMPAFKNVLNEAERWAVLAYVHDRYHKGIANVCIQGEGVLNAIDQDKRKVTISHGAIAALSWPAMRMDFAVNKDVDLEKPKVGQKIKFCLMKSGEYDYVVSGIQPVH